MRSRKGAGSLSKPGAHVVRLADQENLALHVRLGLDQGRDRAHSRRKERAVRREAIGGSHRVPVRPRWPLARSQATSTGLSLGR